MSDNTNHSQVTSEQLAIIDRSHKNIQDFINLANKMRYDSEAGKINFFNQFFLKLDKFV